MGELYDLPALQRELYDGNALEAEAYHPTLPCFNCGCQVHVARIRFGLCAGCAAKYHRLKQ